MAKPSVREVIEATEARKLEDYVLDAAATRREYLTEFHSRQRKLDAFIGGDWPVEFPDGRIVRDRPKIENRVVTKIEDTGKLAGTQVPSIHVEPLDKRDAKNSQRREQVIRYYWQMSDMSLLLPRLFMDMIGTGICALLVWPDFQQKKENRFPVYKRIDPRFLLPPLDYVIEGTLEPHDVITHRMVKLRNLARDYPTKAAELQVAANKIAQSVNRGKDPRSHIIVSTASVLVIEYWGKDGIMRLACVDGYPETAVVLENEYNEVECCPVVLGVRPTADGHIRGQVEHMMPQLAAENRLMTYVLDYADQAVYAPLAKKGTVVNAEDFGPGAIIDLGPDGEITRVPPATIRPEVFKIIQDLERHSRRGGNLPEARAGDVSQSIGSAAFVESLMGGLTTEVQSYQSVMEIVLRKANEIAQKEDVKYCNAEKEVYGLAKGGSYREKYVPEALLKDISNYVSYGAGMGLDKLNTEARITQRQRSGYVSEAWVMEQLDGIDNAAKMKQQIIEEAMLKTVLAGLFAQAQQAGNIAPLTEFYNALQAEVDPLMVLDKMVALSVPVNQPPGPEPGGPAGTPAGAEQQALTQGGLPGASPNVPPTEGQLPPLPQILG